MARFESMLPVPIRLIKGREKKSNIYERSGLYERNGLYERSGSGQCLIRSTEREGYKTSISYNYTSCGTCMEMYQYSSRLSRHNGVQLNLQTAEEMMNNNNLTMDTMATEPLNETIHSMATDPVNLTMDSVLDLECEEDDEVDSMIHVSSWLEQVNHFFKNTLIIFCWYIFCLMVLGYLLRLCTLETTALL